MEIDIIPQVDALPFSEALDAALRKRQSDRAAGIIPERTQSAEGLYVSLRGREPGHGFYPESGAVGPTDIDWSAAVVSRAIEQAMQVRRAVRRG